MTINQPIHTNNAQNESSTSEDKPEQLTAQQMRVLACLMEKQLTTPNNYPLSINALMNACNQKSNREPIMTLSEGEVGQIVHQLEAKDLARLEYGDRANKVFHKARGSFQLDIDQQALLSVMMLRKPQTLNELKTRTARMTHFADHVAVKACLQTLINRDIPLVQSLAKGQGRREERYTQCLHQSDDHDLTAASTHPAETPSSDPTNSEPTDELQQLKQSISALEQRVAELERCLS